MSTANAVCAKRIKEARIAAGLSQRQLGIKSGLDEFTASTRINRYEQGVHQADYPMSRSLAHVLNVPVAYLYCDDDDLAEALLTLHRMPPAKRRKAITGLLDL